MAMANRRYGTKLPRLTCLTTALSQHFQLPNLTHHTQPPNRHTLRTNVGIVYQRWYVWHQRIQRWYSVPRVLANAKPFRLAVPRTARPPCHISCNVRYVLRGPLPGRGALSALTTQPNRLSLLPPPSSQPSHSFTSPTPSPSPSSSPSAPPSAFVSNSCTPRRAAPRRAAPRLAAPRHATTRLAASRHATTRHASPCLAIGSHLHVALSPLVRRRS